MSTNTAPQMIMILRNHRWISLEKFVDSQKVFPKFLNYVTSCLADHEIHQKV